MGILNDHPRGVEQLDGMARCMGSKGKRSKGGLRIRTFSKPAAGREIRSQRKTSKMISKGIHRFVSLPEESLHVGVKHNWTTYQETGL